MCNQCKKLLIKKVSESVGVLAISQMTLSNILTAMPKCPAMKALEELTPMGSEFWEDPDFCYKYLREARASQHKLLIQTAGQRNDLATQVQELEKQLKEKSNGN